MTYKIASWRPGLGVVATLLFAGLTAFAILGAGVAKAQSDKPTVWKFWHAEPAEVTLGGGEKLRNPYHGGALKFKEIVERDTGGKYVVDIFFGGQLYSGDREVIEALQAGAIELAITASAPLSAWEPTISVLDLPFIFPDVQTARRVLDGEIGDELLKNLERHGIKGLSMADNTFRNLETRERTVKTPDDLKGLKIRVMRSAVFIEMFKALGASPTPMPATEVYTALQTGVIDGYEHPIFPYLTNRNYEVAKKFSWTNHSLTAAPYLMSMKVWSSLAPEVQEIVLRAATEARDLHRKYVEDINTVAKDLLKKEGVIFTNVDNAAFKEKMAPVYAKFEDEIGKDLIDRVKNFK